MTDAAGNEMINKNQPTEERNSRSINMDETLVAAHITPEGVIPLRRDEHAAPDLPPPKVSSWKIGERIAFVALFAISCVEAFAIYSMGSEVASLRGQLSQLAGGKNGENVALGKKAMANSTSATGNLAIGNGSLKTLKSGNNNFAFGRGTDVGDGAVSESVMIGNGTIASRSYEFSVGAPGSERVVGNAAPGTKDSDLVTLGQVRALLRGGVAHE